MTRVNLSAMETTLGGFAPIKSGVVTATYWAGRGPRVEVAGEQVRFPAPIRVAIVDGAPVADVELVPTRGVACVRWLVEDTQGRRAFERYTEIPDMSVVDFGALTQVDPATFEPTGEVVAGWEATVAEAREAVAVAGASASAASTAAGEAESARSVAVAARSAAEAASTSASGAAAVAGQARTAAEAAASAAAASAASIDGRIPRGGTRWVAVGDSLTSVAGGGAPNMGWTMQAGMLTDQGLALTYNAGIVGNNASEVLARLQADVLAYAPNFVTVWVGTNDITQGRSLATYQGEMGQIVERLQAAGCTVAIITIPPRADTTKHAAIGAWNAWLRNFARARSCHLIDAYALLVDPATGTYKTGYDAGDGLHITQAGHHVIARYVADTIAPRLALSESIRPLSNTDTNNMLSNGLLIGGATIPDSWLVAGPTGGITESIVTDPGFRGRAWEVAAVNPAGARQFLQNARTGTWAVGDRLLATARVDCLTATGVSATKGLRLSLLCYGATSPTTTVVQMYRLPGLKGVVAATATVPAGTTTVQLASIVDVDATASATYRIGEAGIFNLTRLGIN